MNTKLIIILITTLLVILVGGKLIYNTLNLNDDISISKQDEISEDEENFDEQSDEKKDSNDLNNNDIKNNQNEENDKQNEENDKQNNKNEENNKQNSEIEEKNTQKYSNPAPPNNVQKDKNIAIKNDDNAKTKTPNNGTFMSQVEQLIFQKVNKERLANGVSQLSYNTTMQNYARIKSKDMGDNKYFNHEDLRGNLITTKMQSDGVSYSAWGENIAYISGNANDLAEQFMKNWMNSEGHRANILSANFTSIGIGVYKIGDRVYATQEFYR